MGVRACVCVHVFAFPGQWNDWPLHVFQTKTLIHIPECVC